MLWKAQVERKGGPLQYREAPKGLILVVRLVRVESFQEGRFYQCQLNPSESAAPNTLNLLYGNWVIFLSYTLARKKESVLVGAGMHYFIMRHLIALENS